MARRATFLGSPVHEAGTHSYELTFTAGTDLAAEDAIITWYLKDAPEGQATATLKLIDIEIFEVKGNKASDKTTYHFYPFDSTTEWTWLERHRRRSRTKRIGNDVF